MVCGICGFFFLWFFLSCSQVVIKKSFKMINNIFHSQDLLSRDVLLMFPKLIGIIIICDFCIMGIPWDVP